MANDEMPRSGYPGKLAPAMTTPEKALQRLNRATLAELEKTLGLEWELTNGQIRNLAEHRDDVQRRWVLIRAAIKRKSDKK